MIERRTAIITGAASGIGKETTSRFATDPKYNPVYAVDKDPSIHTVFQASTNPNMIPLETDISKREEVLSLLQRVFTETGRIDVVVNAAGVMIKGRKSTFYYKNGEPTSEQETMQAINLYAPIWIMVAASGLMRNDGGGTIVNVTSTKHYFPDVHHGEYQEGKQKLSKAIKRLAKSYEERDGVRLVDVQPGNTKTNIDRSIWTNGNASAEIQAAQAVTDWWMKTFGNDPKNVAEVIYKAAEGEIDKRTILVGADAKIGRALYLLTYPLAPYRFDYLFAAGSYLFYQAARLVKTLKDYYEKS